MNIAERKGWKTLGRKKAENLMWKLWHAKEAATLKRADFTAELKEQVKNHHHSWIVTPLEETINDICEIYKLRKPI